MNWINDLRKKAKDKWIEWHKIEMGHPNYSNREANVALYTGMIRMADMILLNARLYDLAEIKRLRFSDEYFAFLNIRMGWMGKYLHLGRPNELDVFLEFLKEREKKLMKYKPLLLEQQKFGELAKKKIAVKAKVS